MGLYSRHHRSVVACREAAGQCYTVHRGQKSVRFPVLGRLPKANTSNIGTPYIIGSLTALPTQPCPFQLATELLIPLKVLPEESDLTLHSLTVPVGCTIAVLDDYLVGYNILFSKMFTCLALHAPLLSVMRVCLPTLFQMPHPRHCVPFSENLTSLTIDTIARGYIDSSALCMFLLSLFPIPPSLFHHDFLFLPNRPSQIPRLPL
jgi:hypothetical protein